MKKRIGILLCSMTILMNVISVNVQAAGNAKVSLQSWNPADSGKHLDWGGTSKYIKELKSLHVCLHELGHALGLGCNQNSDVMYAESSWVIKLSKNDKASYDKAYKKYDQNRIAEVWR